MYVFVPSFPSIYFAIYNAFISNKLVTVITNNDSVKLISNELNIDVVFFNFELNYRNLFSTKRDLRKLVNKLDTKRSFYLLDNVHCLEGFYLAQIWRSGNVYFQNLSTDFDEYENSLNLKNILLKTIYKYSLGLDLVFRNQNEKPVIGIGSSFINKNKIKFLNLKNYNSLRLKVLENIKLKTKTYNSILVLQGSLKGVIKEKSLNKTYKYLESLNSLAIKEHPKHSTSDLFISNEKIPKFYPVELCYSNINKNIISIFSLSLILASQLKDKKAISLLELVEWEDVRHKNKMKKVLISESKKIFFPKDFEELKKNLNS